MGNNREIFQKLKEKSKNEYVADFLKELFILENQGLHHWTSKYDDLIDKYYKGYLNED